MKKYYDSISVELDSSKNFIFLCLAFDPEATIMSRARFSSQISIIKQLSQNLPENWILYIKRTP